MSNEKKIDPEEFNELLAALLVCYNASTNAMQFQDVHSAEQNAINAKMIRKRMGLVESQEDEVMIAGLVGYIEVAWKFLKANFYLFDERYSKALENFEMAKVICAQETDNLNTLDQDTIDDQDLVLILVGLRFSFSFFNHVISVMQPMSQKLRDQMEGKYVNEVELYNAGARELRSFKYDDNFSQFAEMTEAIAACVGMLNRMADVYEKKAERLEEKRKTIQYIAPHDNRVFIIHGHADGNLRELKELLQDHFKINPIILKDENDKGKTVIEKLEEYGRLCGYAFAIVTPDDVVENKKKKSFQARPNVLFELGWFSGRFGRSKIRILRQKEVGLPSDLNGLITSDYNVKISELFLEIKADLTEAGII